MSIKAPKKLDKSTTIKIKTDCNKRPSISSQTDNKSGIYSVVYCSLPGKFFASLLLLTFFSQAIYVVNASEITAADSELAQVELLDTDQNLVPEIIHESNDGVRTKQSLDQIAKLSSTDIEIAESFDDDFSDTEKPGLAISGDDEGDYALAIGTDDQAEAIEATKNDDADSVILSPTETDVSSPDLPTSTAEEEEAVESANESAVSVISSDSTLLFNRSECTELASGSFYCYQVPDSVLGDALFAAPDEDGDLEIFLIRNGIQQQITSNLADDAAPFYDELSNSIVWHRLIDDRYQIMTYSLSTNQEVQITSGSINNMEPVRQGEYIAWQRWDSGVWQIVLFDGVRESVVSKGTDSNVAPSLNNELLVWTRHTAMNQKSLEVYNLTTGSYFSLDDPDGLAVANPRMMLVYDTVQPGGDTVTRGFDLMTGRYVDIDTTPKSLPDELPRSEQTGETRALIQSKPTLKVSDNVESDDGFDGPSVGKVVEDTHTLDMRTSDHAVSDNADISATTQDLVVPDFVPSSSTTAETVKEVG